MHMPSGAPNLRVENLEDDHGDGGGASSFHGNNEPGLLSHSFTKIRQMKDKKMSKSA